RDWDTVEAGEVNGIDRALEAAAVMCFHFSRFHATWCWLLGGDFCAMMTTAPTWAVKTSERCQRWCIVNSLSKRARSLAALVRANKGSGSTRPSQPAERTICSPRFKNKRKLSA